MVISEITPDEYQSLDTALSTGLGFGLSPKLEIAQPTDINESVKNASAGCPADLPKVEKELQIVLTRCSTSRSFTQPRIPDHVNSPAPQPMAPSSICKKEVRILLDKLSINANQRFLVSRNIVVGAGKVASGNEDEKIKGSGTIEIGNYSSDNTEAYWLLDPKKQILLFPKVNVQDSMMPTAKLALTCRFNIQVHGIPCRKLHYYFKCVLSGCVKTFDKICNWNLHHCLAHKTKIKCSICGKKFTMPSSHRAHKNIHAVHKFNCQMCQKSFAFASGLCQHKNFHNKSKEHRCFHGVCKKAFKWPQDLARCIQCHMNPKRECNKYDYVFEERRLLECHKYKHLNIFRYKCNK